MRARLAALAVVAVVSTGCAGPFGLGGISPEAVAQAVKDKSATAGCVKVSAAGGSGTIVIINVDKGVPAGTKITPDCGVEFMTGTER